VTHLTTSLVGETNAGMKCKLSRSFHGRTKKTVLYDALTNWKHRHGHAVAQLFEALRYKLEDRGVDCPWCH
jgi:hypothetical protein